MEALFCSSLRVLRASVVKKNNETRPPGPLRGRLKSKFTLTLRASGG